MHASYIHLCFAATLAFAAQSAIAQAGGLTGEIAARQAADAQLQNRIDAEVAARQAGDTSLGQAIEELRASVGGESSIVGRYAFTGTTVCLSSSAGFSTQFEFEPNVVFPQPSPPAPAPVPGSLVQMSSHAVSGVRTFNADRTGHATSTFHTISYPSNINQFRTGGASSSTLENTFRYEVIGDDVFIDDDEPAIGRITRGGRAVGGTVETTGVPRFVGKISKDKKIISLTHESLAIETSIVTPVGGTPQTTPRVCHRERTLYRIE